MTTKMCSKCGETRPLAEFAKAQTGKDGHRSDCRLCRNAYNRSLDNSNPERKAKRLEANTQWHIAHPGYSTEKSKEWAKANPARKKEYEKERYAKNPEAARARTRQSKAKNPEHYADYAKFYREEHKEDIKQRDTIDKQRTRWQKRRAIKKEAFVEVVIFSVVVERDNFKCGLCHELVDMEFKWPNPASPSLDHVVPLSKGGEHSYSNTQLAHIGCNWKKNNKV